MGREITFEFFKNGKPMPIPGKKGETELLICGRNSFTDFIWRVIDNAHKRAPQDKVKFQLNEGDVLFFDLSGVDKQKNLAPEDIENIKNNIAPYVIIDPKGYDQFLETVADYYEDNEKEINALQKRIEHAWNAADNASTFADFLEFDEGIKDWQEYLEDCENRPVRKVFPLLEDVWRMALNGYDSEMMKFFDNSKPAVYHVKITLSE